MTATAPAVAAPLAELTGQVSSRQAVRAVLASILAWSFDLFDLFILLFLAPTLGPLFFPSGSATLSLAGVYGAFAVTLVMRPVGSALFGSYADRRGRKRAMTVAVVGVGLVTALMGALPTYPQVGVGATIAFLALRLAQGVLVGGVVASTHTIGTESIGTQWRGLMSGLIAASAGLGALFASLVYSLASHAFPGREFAIWGWRCMFFAGLVGSGLSLLVLRGVEDSPLWTKLQKGMVQAAPVRALLSPPWRPVLIVNVFVVAGGAIQYYLTSGYFPTFLARVNGLTKAQASRTLIVANAVVIVGCVLWGQASQVVGRKRCLLTGALINAILIPALYLRLAELRSGSAARITLLTAALAFLATSGYAPVLIFLNERFPTSLRATGTALSWNLGFALGGMMPALVSLAAPTVADIPLRLIFILIAGITMSLAGIAAAAGQHEHFR
jgi:MFS family permease